MKLSLFISDHLEEIHAEWVSFAQTLRPAAGKMTVLALQDHAKAILQAIALDIETQQNPSEQYAKSRGHAPEPEAESAASVHGTLRQTSDFSLIQLGAEFRALRATVLRLWLLRIPQMSPERAFEMIRFNEAIDQALAESIVTYSAHADQSRELFLAILGHDLRAPLSSMSLVGALLVRPETAHAQMAVLGARVERSARLMTQMVNDLLGFTRTQMGSKMPTEPGMTDVGSICKNALEDSRSVSPTTEFELTTQGNLSGLFDNVRLHQLFTNLLVNAAQYGAKGRPVAIDARRNGAEIVVQVHNHGAVIPEDSWRSIFKPLIQLPQAGKDDQRLKTSLGLGLFVAREIALAHSGSIEVTSDVDKGTVFTVRLPVPVTGRHPTMTSMQTALARE